MGKAVTKSTQKNTHSIQTVAVVLLLLLFAFSSLILVSLGASVYEKNVSDMQGASAERTAYAYLTQKVRQGDVFVYIQHRHQVVELVDQTDLPSSEDRQLIFA